MEASITWWSGPFRTMPMRPGFLRNSGWPLRDGHSRRRDERDQPLSQLCQYLLSAEINILFLNPIMNDSPLSEGSRVAMCG